MSLPVVSYGTYNYGDYAKPTPIRYKGGFGEALTGAAVGLLKRDRLNKEKAEAQLKQANEQSLLASSKFNAQLNQAFGKASATNRQFLQGLKQEYGDAVKAYKLDNLSFEEYENKITYFQNILNDATQLSAIMKPIIESDTEIGFEDIRGDDDNKAALLARYGIQNGKYLLEKDENGLRVVLPHGAGPSNFEAKSISASELISNTKYMTPEIKYDNLTNAGYGNMLSSLREMVLDNSDFLNIKNDAKLKSTLFSINENQKDGIIQKISQQQGLRNIFLSADGTLDKDKMRYYYEDNMGMGLGSYKGTREQLNEMNMSIAEDMYESMASMEVLGKKSYSAGNTSNVTSREEDYNTGLSAFNEAIFNPTTFYNLNIVKSPYQQTNEGAKYLGNGKYEITTDVVDEKTGQLVPGGTRTIDLKDFDSFQQYAGTIIDRHRSLQGQSGGTKQAIGEVNQDAYIKQKFDEYQMIIKSLDEKLPDDVKAVNESKSAAVDLEQQQRAYVADEDLRKIAEGKTLGVERNPNLIQRIGGQRSGKDYSSDDMKKIRKAQKQLIKKYPLLKLKYDLVEPNIDIQ